MYFKTLIIILLCLKSMEAKLFDYDEDFISLIESEKIFVNGHFESIQTLTNKLHVSKTKELFASENPNIVYKVLNCKYAHFIVDFLELFFEIYNYGLKTFDKNKQVDMESSWKEMKGKFFFITDDSKHEFLNKAGQVFMNLKVYILIIIKNLFDIEDNNQNLRTSDRSFLKSLLAINIFFFYVQKYDIQNLNILQLIYYMIGLVNRFRFRKCETKVPNKNIEKIQKLLNDKTVKSSEIIDKILEPTIQRSSSLIVVFFNNNDNFSFQTYSPATLLWEDILEYYFDHDKCIANIIISSDAQNSTLIDVYNKIITNTCNIDDIFDYQNTLVNVIADTFYRQVHGVLIKADIELIVNRLKGLQYNFNRFTSEIIPRLCLKDACKKIVLIKLSLDEALQNYDIYKNMQVFEPLADKLKLVINEKIIYPITFPIVHNSNAKNPVHTIQTSDQTRIVRIV